MFLTFFLLLISIGAAFVIVPKLLHVDEVLIPEDLAGMEYSEVYEALTALGLTVEKETMLHEEIPEDHVVRTNPEGGRTVKVNSIITVYVSEGKEKIEMVEVTETDKEQARRTLIRLGFKEENIEEVPKESDSIENLIIEQLPLPGEKIVPEETVVILTYSIPMKFSLENLHGLTRLEAIERLNNLGLNIDVKEEYSDRIPEDHVIDQKPARETIVQKGTTVTVIVSLGPEPEPPPEPINTVIVAPVPLSPEDEMAGIEYPVIITYRDSNVSEHTLFVERNISKLTEFRVPVTINPGDKAEVIRYIAGEQYGDPIILTYEEALANQ
ncbi:PASTA domain-containing protein [Anaerobacillus sp. CMMVII]|uniref:PASTA domain-containing protein n=1 Tax=Anaerobacillus sp. CMMVII TaxID=2755588 RepID=UPI0021B6FBFA|nr:PASTA domain-containing protein [Anaerobacillus sp. CMMVII]MCT8139780.1 PASTA domain-containing protein [Anaerobacillus sp. CMMVII]